MLEEHLEKLDAIVDPAHQARSEELMRHAVSYEPVERLPLTASCPVPGWPTFSYRETFGDVEKMLLAELAAVWAGANIRDDRVYTIRGNYGVGAVASMFGCEIRLTGDNVYPWITHLGDAALDKALESGDISIESGLGARLFETERFYLKTLSQFENLRQCVHIYLSDTQGPFDNAHLIMGHKIYTELYDNPNRVHRLLDQVTDTCIRYARAQKELIGEDGRFSFHSQMVVPGAVRICDDSGINLSAELYREFSKPYNERLFAELGGGWIHYCGDGKQILPEVLSTRGIKGVNFGQPEMQDLASVYRDAAPKRVAVLGWMGKDRVPKGIGTGMTLVESAPNIESARQIAGSG